MDELDVAADVATSAAGEAATADSRRAQVADRRGGRVRARPYGRMVRSCAFCGKKMQQVDGQRGRTEEHCFPKWLAPYILGGGDEWEHTVAATDTGDIKRRYTKRELAVVSRKICRTCNSGWMERLESAVRGFLPALIQGQAGELSTGGQRLLAAWAVKTALCLELANPVEHEPIPAEHYRAIARLKDTPPPRTQVILATYSGPRLCFHAPTRLHLPGGAHGYRSVFVVGRAAFTVIGHNHPDELIFKSDGAAELMPQVWPTAKPLTWPTPLAMRDRDLETYAGVDFGGASDRRG